MLGLNRAVIQATFPAMDRRPPELDMTIAGEFRSPRKPPLLNRIMLWAIVVAVIAGGMAFAALALWLAMVILPVAIAAAAIAWGIWRYQVWRAKGAGPGSISGGRDIWRR